MSNNKPLLKPTTLNDNDLSHLGDLMGEHNLSVVKFVNDHQGFTHTEIEHVTNCGPVSVVAHQRINPKTRSMGVELACFPINGTKRKHCWYVFKSADLLNSELVSLANKGILG